MQYRKHRLTHLVSAAVAPLAVLMTGCAHTDVPKPLDRIESAAEDAYDEALAAKNKDVEHEAEAIEQAWTVYRPSATRDGAPSEAVEGLDSAVKDFRAVAKKSSDPVAVARAANAVSRWVGALYSVYHPATPAILNELDYLGREVALDGKAGDLAHAETSIAKLEETWHAVRPRLAAAGANFTAQKYEETLAGIHEGIASRNAGAVVFHAKKGLDAVDVMETVLHD
jgi:hypothetical protein